MERLTEDRYHETASARGFEFRGPYPCVTRDKVEWKCEEGHRWKATYWSIRNGNGCPFCAGLARKIPADYYTLAETRGFRWEGTEVSNVMTNTRWGCEYGHHWQATFNAIQNGNGCPRCAGLARKTEQDYYVLAQKREIEWSGPFPRSIHHTTKWMCTEGHFWEAAYNNIRHGSGCPRCARFINGARASNEQVAIAEMLGAEVNYQFDDTRMRIDCALPKRQIAVEFDCWFWHADKAQEDYERVMALIEKGWKVLSVKANTQLPTAEQLDECVEQLSEHPYIELILDWGHGSTKASLL